ncbi:MAG: hypothetical protein SGJ24_06805 [Chloroflexota bacterium]|nr:hypothetical protein [Chloroflexota bacterium]
MSTLDDLLASIFDDETSALYADFAGWVRRSRRFKDFALVYRDKIRSKLRNVRDPDAMHDLRAELETAALLLSEKQFTLEYEKYAASRQRGPDFTVTFKSHTPFNLEVRRLRTVEVDDANAEAHITKLRAVLCDKAGQMPPGIVNLLWLTGERPLSEADLIGATTALRQLAERKDEEFFTRRGFSSAADFLKQFGHLGAIVLRQAGTNVIWLNALARYKAPAEIVRIITRLEMI